MAEIPVSNPEATPGTDFSRETQELIIKLMQRWSNLIITIKTGRSVAQDSVRAMGGNLSREQEERYLLFLATVEEEKRKVNLTEDEIAVFDRISNNNSAIPVSEAEYRVLESYKGKVENIVFDLANKGFSKNETMG